METVKNLANGIKASFAPTKGATAPSRSGIDAIKPPTKIGPTSPLVDDHPTPLKIIVIGAGIGGLSAALSLRRNGHDVEVCPKSSGREGGVVLFRWANRSLSRSLNSPALPTR